MRNIIFIILFSITLIFTPIFAEEDTNLTEGIMIESSYEEDIVHYIINYFDFHSYEIISEGKYDNNISYTVYNFNNNMRIIISIDENGLHYLIGNALSNEAMREMLDYLTGIYTEPVPYLNGDGYSAFFHDTENLYIKDNFPDYIGTFTLYGNYMFAEEVITQEKIIIQRQWCTPDFYEINTNEFGENWGFIAQWDTIEYEEITLPAQYTVRSWKETGDSLSAIAGLPFIYGDPSKWRTLYEVNRSKLSNPNNPHLIHPGTILDIPSLNDEIRSGMWNYNTQ